MQKNIVTITVVTVADVWLSVPVLIVIDAFCTFIERSEQ